MTKLRQVTFPATLLFAALALSACATKTKEEPVAAPTTPVAEQPAAQPAPAPEVKPAVKEEAPVPKHVARKHQQKVAKAVPKPVEPAPVAEPAPAPKPVAQAAPAPAPVVEAPAPVVKEKGFLESSWMWLLAVIAGATIFGVWRKWGK